MPKPKELSLTIAWLYPNLMSIYGDRGNIIVLQKRCLWRNIQAKIMEISLESNPQDLAQCDLIMMGGAQDRQQKIVANDLMNKKGPILKKLVEEGRPGLFICGAYQFLGHYYQPANGPRIPGLSLFDIHTIHPGPKNPRAIGNIAVKRQNEILVGFENHGGRTFLGPSAQPFGKVLYGAGNNGKDGTEGILYQNSIGSYMHGPILPKNPKLADWLIEKALYIKYATNIKLENLDDQIEESAKKSVLQKLKLI